jgi:hypothetical protein
LLGWAAGITEEQIQVIGTDDYMDSPLLNDREKAAVLWAEHVTHNTARSRDDIFEIVRKQFSEAGTIELTFIISYFNMWNRFNDSLQIPLEEQKEVYKILVNVNTNKLKNYLQYVVDNWPDDFPEPHPDE